MSAGHVVLGLVMLFSLLIMALHDHAQLANQTALAEEQAQWRSQEVLEKCVINPTPGLNCANYPDVCITTDNVVQVSVIRHWEASIWKGLSPVSASHRLSLDTLTGFGLGTGGLRAC